MTDVTAPPEGTGIINWRIKQFREFVASGSGPESEALAEARRYIYLYELDDATTMTLQVQRSGETRWRNVAAES